MPVLLRRAMRHTWIVLKRAWAESISFIGWSWRTVMLLLLPAIVAFVFLALFPANEGFRDYLVSGFYALVVSTIVFALIFSFNLLLAPSALYFELSDELSAQIAQIRERADKNEIADILKRRYDEGNAIRNRHGIANFSRLETQKAMRWHQENLRLFKDLLPDDEYYMYETIAPDPDVDTGSPPSSSFWFFNYHEIHAARLGKLRRITARVLKG